MLRFDLRGTAPAFILLLALFPAGCMEGAQLKNEQELQDALGCDMDTLFESCSGISCHTGRPGTAPRGGLDFSAAGFPTNLVGMPALYPPGAAGLENCPVDAREVEIDPNNPDNSLFLKKLYGTQACGASMPDGYFLPPDDVECFRTWVLEVIAQSGASGGASSLGSGGTGTGGALP